MAEPTEMIRLQDVRDLLEQAQDPRLDPSPLLHALRGAIEYLPRLAISDPWTEAHAVHPAAHRLAHLRTLTESVRGAAVIDAELAAIRTRLAIANPVHTLPLTGEDPHG